MIVATYNRSRVLSQAIASVRRQTMTDWELIVVGDHCTDDSADIVASFHDPRITFVNLPVNAGEQSGPNNEGLRRARGRFIAYLNHDDMFFPDHLERAVAWLEREAADFVWSPVLLVEPTSSEDQEAGRWKIRLIGVPPGDG